MNTLSMPDGPGFSSASFGLVSATQVFQSPLSGQTQTLDLGWDFWQASYVLKPMKAQQAGQWKAFLAQLRGRSGRFYGFDPMADCGCGMLGKSVPAIPANGRELVPSTSLAPSDSLAPGGVAHPGYSYPDSLTLTLSDDVERGESVACVNGWPSDDFDWSAGVNPKYDPSLPLLCGGQYIQIGDELKMMTVGVYPIACATSSCIGFVPPMRASANAGTAVVNDGAVAEMRLVDDGQAQWAESPGGIFNISFSAVEAI